MSSRPRRSRQAKAAQAAQAKAAAEPPVAPEPVEDDVPPALPEPTSEAPAAAGGSAVGGAGAPTPSSVVYVGHLPRGFYEREMRKFFKQFGDVKRLRLARARKSGASQHYAFVEFEHPEVAEIVARAMNNYFMVDKYLVCHVVPAEKLHVGLFAGGGRTYKPIPWRLVARKQHNKPKTVQKSKSLYKAAVKRHEQRMARVKAAGIDYNLPA